MSDEVELPEKPRCSERHFVVVGKDVTGKNEVLDALQLCSRSVFVFEIYKYL